MLIRIRNFSDPGSGMGNFGSGMVKLESGIQDKHPGSATLETRKFVGKISSLGSGKGGDEETEQEDLLLPGPAGETPQEEGARGATGSQ
jgi:hypothetical protein